MATPIPLRSANLGAIEALGVPTPHYDRQALRPRILHLGVGGFHRAHMALYTDEVAADGGQWGIHGVGLLEGDRRMADVLRAQDDLYTLIERDSDGATARVVGSIVDYTLAAGEGDAFAQRIADPELAVLSMTITEGGYSLANGNPTIEAIVAGLEARRLADAGPLTILSCDNLPGNGDVARAAIVAVAESKVVDLPRFLESCTFPNSMVDRITPQTHDVDRAAYLMALAGVVYVDEAIAIPAVRRYLERLLAVEVIPTLVEIPGHPATAYAEIVLQRFANTGVRDQIARLCIDGTAKFKSFLVPTLDTQVERGGPIACGALALAAWARYLATVPSTLRAPDSLGERAAALAQDSLAQPAAFLDLDDVFTPSLRESARFRDAFTAAVTDLASLGPHGAIDQVSS